MKSLLTPKIMLIVSIIPFLISCNKSPKGTISSRNEETISSVTKEETLHYYNVEDSSIPADKVPPEGLYVCNFGKHRDAIKVEIKDRIVKFQIGEDKFNLKDDKEATIDENGQIRFSDYPTAWYEGDGVIMMAGYYFNADSDENAKFVRETFITSDSDYTSIGLEWDEASAIIIIEQELSKYPDWSDVFHADSIKLINSFQFFSKEVIGKRELIFGFAYSTWYGNTCKGCRGVLSIFEFENKSGWRLANKGIAFSRLSSEDNFGINKLGENKYGILITNIIHEDNGDIIELIQDRTLYTFIEGKLASVLHIPHRSTGDDNYNVTLKKVDKDDYYYLVVEESEITENSNPNITRKTYTFNGTEYEEFSGTITDPSLTSIDRFFDFNSIGEREDNICPNCHGTGEQVCPSCRGTGVNNMGIECLCVRTYETELTAGNTPNHLPKKWTCLSCGGSGKYRN